MISKRALQRTTGLVILVLLMTGCTPKPVLDGLVDVGGYELRIKCKGEGSPTVIFDSGLGYSGSGWFSMQASVAELTRACFYDRVGLGLSDPCPKASYTTQDMVEDLHTLLGNANIAGPYVLVAHDMAGFNARVYASQYPQDVAGIVLVDVVHPDWIERSLTLFPPESPDDGYVLKREREFFSGGYRDLIMEGPEFVDWDTSIAQVRATGSLGSIPLVVLTRDRERPLSGFPPELAESLYQEWVQMHQELAALTSNGTHIIVEDSGTFIHEDQPEAVIDAIRSVVESVRGE